MVNKSQLLNARPCVLKMHVILTNMYLTSKRRSSHYSSARHRIADWNCNINETFITAYNMC